MASAVAEDQGRLASEDYIELLRGCHEDPSWGTTGTSWAGAVQAIFNRYQPETALDYGAGKGHLADLFPIMACYDPATFPDEPAPADVVVCTDVLEHIEPDCLDAVLDHLASKVRKAAFLVVSTVPAIKHLPDGRNAHLIVEQASWWLPKLMQRLKLIEFQNGDGGFVAVMERGDPPLGY
jgi:hypothetical protein